MSDDERLAHLVLLYHHLPTDLLRERLVALERDAFGPVPARYGDAVAAERADALRRLELVRAELAKR